MTARQEQIMQLLQEHHVLTVSKLSELTYTSESSIRRDLTYLQNMCFLRRTHGGATILNEASQVAPLDKRMTKNIVGKRKIAKKADSLIHDGQSIMLDGSSTAGFIVPHLAKYRDITVFTNNMITAINSINYGIPTYCIGGSAINHSAVLSGEQAYRMVSEIHPDILFFSCQSLDKNGVISDPTQDENYIRTLMMQNAMQTVFLCDSEKFNRRSLFTLTTLNDVDYCILDIPWNELKAKCKFV